MTAPAPASAAAPFEVYSVHFDFPGGQAIRLVDPAVSQPHPNPQMAVALGATPEWVTGGRDELAAYVRKTQPHLRVVFRGTPGTSGTFTVGATGTHFRIEERQVALSFGNADGLSAPEVFQADGPLPDRIGVHDVELQWYIQGASGSPQPAVGATKHRICTTWKAMTLNYGQELYGWVYKPLVEWTCGWAAGMDDPKDICDAIFANLRHSGLHYGRTTPAPVRTVGELLIEREAMCGVWYKAFQQMGHCQGVFVHRRMFCVDCRPMPGGEQHWCAIVVCDGGLNRAQPTHPASEFHDNDGGMFPFPGAVVLTTRFDRRYRFWGWPNRIFDGHCLNFLEHGGRLYLYDACFERGPVEINMPLPPTNGAAHGGAQLAPFKASYLDGAIDYMLGTLLNGTVPVRSIWSVFPQLVAVQNGVTVRTRDIPEVINGGHGLTFRWIN
jgi:hypothetical protein